MQEYWVNVYENNYFGWEWDNRDKAISVSTIRSLVSDKCLYRIHVKMKDTYPYPKDSGFYQQKIGRPKRG